LSKIVDFLTRALVRLPSPGWLFFGFWAGSIVILVTKSDFWFLVAAGSIWIVNLHTPITHWVYRRPPFRTVRALRHRLIRLAVLRATRPYAYLVINQDSTDSAARQEALKAFVAGHPESRYLKLHKGVAGTVAVAVNLPDAPKIFSALANEVGFRYLPVDPDEWRANDLDFEGKPESVFVYPERYLEESDLAALRAILPPQAQIFDGGWLDRVLENARDQWLWDSLLV
jgi:hypothetical protein